MMRSERENDIHRMYIRDASVWIFEVTTQDEEQRSRKEQRAGRAVSNMSIKLRACVTMLSCRSIDVVVNDITIYEKSSRFKIVKRSMRIVHCV